MTTVEQAASQAAGITSDYDESSELSTAYRKGYTVGYLAGHAAARATYGAQAASAPKAVPVESIRKVLMRAKVAGFDAETDNDYHAVKRWLAQVEGE